MKVALMLTGLARKVEEGYKHYWKYIIDNHDVDLYLHCWQDEEYKRLKKYILITNIYIFKNHLSLQNIEKV